MSDRIERTDADEQLHAVYDELGDAFVEWAYQSAWNKLYDQPTVTALLPQVAGTTVLDIGCGPGAYFQQLLDAGARVIGTDASQHMISCARARHGRAVELYQHDAERPFTFLEDDCVDVAICALMVHYLRDPTPLLREARRVLSADGVLVLSTHHPTYDWLRHGGSYFDRALETTMWRSSTGEHPVRFWRMSLTELAASFSEAGFVIERLVEHEPSEEMARADIDAYECLAGRPGFIAFRLRPVESVAHGTGRATS